MKWNIIVLNKLMRVNNLVKALVRKFIKFLKAPAILIVCSVSTEHHQNICLNGPASPNIDRCNVTFIYC